MKVITLALLPLLTSPEAEDVVEILQEGLILDFVVSEDEGDTLLPPTYLSWAEDVVEIFQEGLVLDFVVCEDDTLAPPPPLPPYLPLLSWGRCWGTPGRPRPWFRCQWSWRWNPCLLPPTYLSWAEDIVEVLQEGLVLDFVVSEDEGDTLASSPLLTSPELRTLLRLLQEGLVLDFVVSEAEGETLASSPYLPLLSWGHCWDTPGRPRPWFHCRWRWRWYPCLPLLTSPELRTLLRYSRKASSLISLSVKMKVIPLPSPPTYLSWAEDVVEILQEGLVLDFIVGEDEGDTLASPSTYLSWAEDVVEVLQEGLVLDFVVVEDEGDTLAFSPYLPLLRTLLRYSQEGLVLDFVVGEDEGDTSDDFSCWRKYLKQAGGRGGRHKAPS